MFGIWLAIGHLVSAAAMAITLIGIPLARNCQDLLIGERRADSVRTPGQYRTAGRSIHRLGVRSVGVSFA